MVAVVRIMVGQGSGYCGGYGGLVLLREHRWKAQAVASVIVPRSLLRVFHVLPLGVHRARWVGTGA
jgi:hypothetical protein